MKWKIIPIMAGEFGMVRDDIKFADGNPSISSFVPSYIYLIDNGKEQYVVDTSFGEPTVVQERIQLIVKREENLKSLLSKAGVRTNSVIGLILTHLHWDHAANCLLFPNASVYCQKDEIEYAREPGSGYDEYYLQEFMQSMERLIEADGDYEIGNGIFLKKCGGHTPGSQCIEVITEEGLAVITGDTIMMYENLKRNVPIGYYRDMEKCKDMLEYLKLKRPSYILPSHDYKTEEYKIESKGLFVWDY